MKKRIIKEVKLYDNPGEFIEKGRKNNPNNKKCSCGHTVEFWTSQNRIICRWCGNYVFRNKKDEFEYRMKERLKNENKDKK